MRRLFRYFKRHLRLIALGTGLVALLGAVFFYFWVFYDLPPVENVQAGLKLPSTRIYDRNGVLLYEISPPEQGRSTPLTLEQVPQHCIDAFIATEDANYWFHPGVDIEGILRALWINLRGGDVIAGGSTITQQTARLLLLDPNQQAERTLQRKLKEAVLAIQLQNATSKEDVLAMYLNQTYFGNLSYGLEAAARAYFSKSAMDLSLAECALLAGMAQNAVLHDPLSNFESAKERQEVALRLMTQQGYLTETQAASAGRDELQFGSTPFPIDAPHFVMAVWKQLERTYPDELYHGGLEVITTVDSTWQRTAQEIAQRQLTLLNHPPANVRVPANANNAAVVAMDPYTGQVLTMLGSPDYFNESIDGAVNAALALRQPGSALKPFTYAAAMNPDLPEPYTAATMILDVETPFITRKLESYTPSNYGQVEHGPVLVREALASSYNIPAVVALEHLGLRNFVAFVGNIGLSNLAQNTDVDLSITLGGGEVRLVDLVQAYSIFPNGGYRIEPQYILSVTTHDGDVLYQWKQQPLRQQVLDERIAYIISDILSDNNARIPSFGEVSPLQIGRPAAAKTGTTTDFRDNWVVGYTPNLVVGVWVGNADNTPMVEITGVSGAGPIYHQFMRRVLRGQPELTFERPEGLTRVEVCSLSGQLPTSACTLTHSEWFIPGTEPTEEDTFYQVFEIDRETGLLADDDTPPETIAEQTFIVLPQEARDWASHHGIAQPPTGAMVLAPDADDAVRLLEPDPYTVFEQSPIVPPETQRLRLTVGAPTGTQQVSYYMDDVSIGRVTEAPWTLWWVLDLGHHELVAEAVLADGTTQRSDPVPFTVVEYQPPQPHTVPVGQ
ncbi:transglycosylase domain-containing protein [Phototrophicus methaneseepsis]|uniref:Transglycosylase domain-containing protein n=1 Tax=Phototrophicus methaneseepsis TaxID=2710758 RepID=A0A7S8EAU8_9CHLR|nr:transglycosylase domain-containing protein [Phototrophicus methaneseepsis]QPC83544.1 transglycosylase domain-containing protein [Phototrophicus methaneseepsis]